MLVHIVCQFNPNELKLLCYNADLTANVPQVYLNGEKIPVVEQTITWETSYQQIL